MTGAREGDGMGEGDSGEAWQILPGWDVRDAADDLVGTVIEAGPTYVLVEQGRFFPDDVYVPLEAVGAITRGVVRLNVTGAAALDEGWHVAPPVGVGALSTGYLAPGIALGGHVEELGTTEEDADGSTGEEGIV
ncbi:MAG: hypothetical protein AVDCRST_MAG19-2323 [uncultured Thermomicrobiales bacterium]|uniref:Uncharacterized protein n=1 Tax=uncultured Thermomicrobiales bacterium TaxID=1645740 RepID=A0A6J4V2G3_9BACT|nr:MAG: hypothetical protein AVDCRST_MAG19-2323 [uncultured Thermomicrobiales bacterium]